MGRGSPEIKQYDDFFLRWTRTLNRDLRVFVPTFLSSSSKDFLLLVNCSLEDKLSRVVDIPTLSVCLFMNFK